MTRASGLEIRLLGEMEVRRAGRPLGLPASKKTRALLAYLAAAPGPHSRSHLCELLWEGPVDPRAELRWSLSKLRPLLDDKNQTRLLAERDRVALAAGGAEVDVAAIADALSGGARQASLEVLEACAARFKGELLEGLELADCYRFQAWLVGERERARRLRRDILVALVARRREQPEAALRHARAWAALDPLDEAAHVALVELLGRLGQVREALRQYETCKRILRDELRTAPSPALEEARRALTSDARAALPPATAAAPLAAVATAEPPAFPPLVGRGRELSDLATIYDAVLGGRGRQLVAVIGEPGIGKTRLLQETLAAAAGRGARMLYGRAFEAEMVRPYGAWIDALRGLPGPEVPAALRADLCALLPELGDGRAAPSGEAAGDRNRLFDAVTRLLRSLGETRPIVLALDDLHWADEASAALLHFAVRALEGARVMLLAAARPGELADNPAARTVVRTLRREHRLREYQLAPLDADATAALAHAVAPGADAREIAVESEGNPLFALEIARARASGEAAGAESLEELLVERFARLDDAERELVAWAAALGRSFPAERLERATGTPSAEFVEALARLERQGILRVSSEQSYDFSHDLLRHAAYRQLSAPRRRLVHRQIAQALAAEPDPEAALAGDLAHHATLGGDARLAASAALTAGQRCLRLFALAEAAAASELGLRQADLLPERERVAIEAQLLRVRVYASLGRSRSDELFERISRHIERARAAEEHAPLQTGLYLRALLQEARGDEASASATTMLQARELRAADDATAARGLANTGRCLAQIERDYAEAESALAEARALAERAGVEVLDVPWGLGLVLHFRGDDDAAVGELERAVDIARREQDHWAAAQCLARRVMVELERGRPGAALELCAELKPVAAKLGEGSEAPFAEALAALASLASGDPAVAARLQAALETLRTIDSKVQLAYVQNLAAATDLAAGRVASARERAAEALTTATAVGRVAQVALARANLALASAADGDQDAGRRALLGLDPALLGADLLSAYVWSRLALAHRALGLELPTPAPTPAPMRPRQAADI